MIRLQNVLNISSRHICEMSWRCLENVLKTLWQDVFKTSWRHLENVLKTSRRRMDKTNILVLTKMSWRRLEDVFWRAKFQTFDFTKFVPDRLLLLKVYKISAKKVQRSCVSWHWRLMQNLKKNRFGVSKSTRIWWKRDFFLPSVSPGTKYTWTPIWRKSLPICFES